MGIETAVNLKDGTLHQPAVKRAIVAAADAILQKHGCGTPLWVDGVNGSNDNNGYLFDSPKLTMTAALALCTDNKNDCIFVIDYWQPTGETWPIVVNKQQVHIIGLAQGNMPYPAIHPPSASSTVSAFQLGSAGQYGSIENLSIGGGTAGGGIEIGPQGQVDGFLMKNLTFGHAWFGTPLNGILQKSGALRGGYGNKIVNCTFLGDLASMTKGAITGNAIDLLGAATSATMMYGTEVRDCIFMGCAIGVNFARASDSIILSNRFTVDDAQVGEAITLSALCYGGMIDDNKVMNLVQAMDYNPYRDLGTNHWGANWRAGMTLPPITA